MKKMVTIVEDDDKEKGMDLDAQIRKLRMQAENTQVTSTEKLLKDLENEKQTYVESLERWEYTNTWAKELEEKSSAKMLKIKQYIDKIEDKRRELTKETLVKNNNDNMVEGST